MSARPCIRLSYHDDDLAYLRTLMGRCGDAMEIASRAPAATGEPRADEVTVVLVGVHTWRLCAADLEIGATLEHRRGLLGILLPPCQAAQAGTLTIRRDGSVKTYDPYLVPPRLHDNVEAGYASLHLWSEPLGPVLTWVKDAIARSRTVEPTDVRPRLTEDLVGARWGTD